MWLFLIYLLKFYQDGLNEQSGFLISRIKMPHKRHAPRPTSSILRLFELLYKRVQVLCNGIFFSFSIVVNFTNPLTAEWALRALIDFTLFNARRFSSSMGNPLDGKGLSSVSSIWKKKMADISNGRVLIVIHWICRNSCFQVLWTDWKVTLTKITRNCRVVGCYVWIIVELQMNPAKLNDSF